MLNSDHINFFFSCNLILLFTEGCISGLYLWIGVLMMWRHYSKTCGVWEDFEKQFWKKEKPQSLSLYMLTEVNFHLRISTHCQRILEGTNSFYQMNNDFKNSSCFYKTRKLSDIDCCIFCYSQRLQISNKEKWECLLNVNPLPKIWILS